MSKHIFITGASQGIGRAVALQFASANTQLTLVARNRERLSAVKKSCSEKGGTVITYSVDLCDTVKLNEIILESNARQKIDIIILCAGITSTTDKSFEPWDSAYNVLKTNLLSPVAAVTSILPFMQKEKNGHIVLFSSLAAYYGMAYTPSYCAGKAGIKAYGEALRQYLKSDFINVSIVFPGFVETFMSSNFKRSKPFMISADKAAGIICRGILKKKAHIRFPFVLQLLIRVLPLMPYKISDYIMKISGYGKK